MTNPVIIVKDKVKTIIDNFNNPPLEKSVESEYIKMKTVEECAELSTALMQSINKNRAYNKQQIEDEIADVLMWVNKLAEQYDIDYISARVEKKKSNYFKNGKLCSDCL